MTEYVAKEIAILRLIEIHGRDEINWIKEHIPISYDHSRNGIVGFIFGQFTPEHYVADWDMPADGLYTSYVDLRTSEIVGEKIYELKI